VPKPFDASTKHLLDTRPSDWLEYLGFTRATFVLLGLRCSRDAVASLLREVRAMRESTTYQAILAE
jgi:hypothetical protein